MRPRVERDRPRGPRRCRCTSSSASPATTTSKPWSEARTTSPTARNARERPWSSNSASPHPPGQPPEPGRHPCRWPSRAEGAAEPPGAAPEDAAGWGDRRSVIRSPARARSPPGRSSRRRPGSTPPSRPSLPAIRPFMARSSSRAGCRPRTVDNEASRHCCLFATCHFGDCLSGSKLERSRVTRWDDPVALRKPGGGLQR